MHHSLLVHSISDVGLVRHNNEDALAALEESRFFVLADGMGGHLAGEVASQKTVSHLCQLFTENKVNLEGGLQDAADCMTAMIRQTNLWVYQLSRSSPAYRGMGTTLCCLYFHPDGVIVAHVGDSRIYLCREGVLEQITNDHSLLSELIDLGQLSEQQADEFHYKNIITRAIGTEADVKPAVKCMEMKTGDLFLMCSDGLSDLVSKQEMQSILTRSAEEDSAKKLVAAAKQRGGYDNISLVLIHVL